MRDEHGLGAGTKERSYCPALADLLNSIGHDLKPRVLCISDLADSGAGHPDFGLYAANQVQKGEPRKGQLPERGVIELKGVADDTWLTADTKQVSKYFGAYRLVIVSNLRDFLIIDEGPNGEATKLEGFRLAPNAKSFWDMVTSPRKSAEHMPVLITLPPFFTYAALAAPWNWMNSRKPDEKRFYSISSAGADRRRFWEYRLRAVSSDFLAVLRHVAMLFLLHQQLKIPAEAMLRASRVQRFCNATGMRSCGMWVIVTTTREKAMSRSERLAILLMISTAGLSFAGAAIAVYRALT